MQFVNYLLNNLKYSIDGYMFTMRLPAKMIFQG
jgi:hypothetical protein